MSSTLCLKFLCDVCVLLQKWAWAFRHNLSLIVHTNNGVEAQNRVFKYDYLSAYRTKSLSTVVTCLVEDFLDDALKK